MPEVLLRSVDFETSDTVAPEAEVIEIGWTDVMFNTETKTCLITRPMSLLFKPSKPLSAENKSIHHLTDKMLEPFPLCTEADIRRVVTAGQPMFLVAHNWAFEGQWFTAEMLAEHEVRPICTMKAARQLHTTGPYTNQGMRYRYGFDDLPEELCTPPHRAAPDSYVTAHVLMQMLQTETCNDLVKWTKAPLKYHTCPLGKYKDKPWPVVDHGYLTWILRADDMDPDITAAAREEIDRRSHAQQP